MAGVWQQFIRTEFRPLGKVLRIRTGERGEEALKNIYLVNPQKPTRLASYRERAFLLFCYSSDE